MFKIEVTELIVLVDELHILTFEGADDFIGRVNKTVKFVVIGVVGGGHRECVSVCSDHRMSDWDSWL